MSKRKCEVIDLLESDDEDENSEAVRTEQNANVIEKEKKDRGTGSANPRSRPIPYNQEIHGKQYDRHQWSQLSRKEQDNFMKLIFSDRIENARKRQNISNQPYGANPGRPMDSITSQPPRVANPGRPMNSTSCRRYLYRTRLQQLSFFKSKNGMTVLEKVAEIYPVKPEALNRTETFLLSPEAHDGNPAFARALAIFANQVKGAGRNCTSAKNTVAFELYRLAWNIAKEDPNQSDDLFKEEIQSHWVWWIRTALIEKRDSPLWCYIRQELQSMANIFQTGSIPFSGLTFHLEWVDDLAGIYLMKKSGQAMCMIWN